jgi:Arc/MetJ family transcription regulator
VGRTNIVIDDELIARAKQLYGLRTKREVVDFALRRLVGDGASPHEALLALEGIGWEGDLDEMRRGRVVDT